MDVSQEVLAGIIGAALGAIATAFVSIILHKWRMAHERRLARERVDSEFLSTTLPVLSKFFSRTTPDRMSSENDVFLMIDEVYASLREGTFRGIFAGTGDSEPIADNVRLYSEALKRYVRREMTRNELEMHRKRALEEVTARWKGFFPKETL